MKRAAFVLVAAGTIMHVAPASHVHGQPVPVSTLQAPDRRYEHGFTRVADVRELRDGRLLVVDGHELTVYVLGPGIDHIEVMGRQGSGPAEYLMPSRILPLTGDSSAIIDATNSRLLVISPDAVPIGVLSRSGGQGVGRSASIPIAAQADGRGFLYGTSRADDGATIIQRWRPGSASAEPIATFGPAPARDGQNIGGMVISRQRAYATATQWAVSPAGVIAVARSAPYQVTMFDPDRTMRAGPSISYEPVPVTEAERRAWREEQERPRPMNVRLRAGGSRVAVMSPGSNDDIDWPRTLPPFVRGALRFAADGSLWVERAVAAGAAPLFDVFDGDGTRVRQVRLPPGARLVGFGDGGVYVVRRDDVDLEYLERHPLPR